MKLFGIFMACVFFVLFPFSAFSGGSSVIHWRPSGEVQLPEYLDLEAYPDDPVTEPYRRGRPGSPWTDPVTGVEFVWVPGGCFQMGASSSDEGRDSDEGPVHEVCLGGFWMGKHEVTIGQYRKYLEATGKRSGVDWSDDDCPLTRSGYRLSGNKFGKSWDQPMVEVDWEGASQFAAWLSSKSGVTVSLPTEAQWEYAARGGNRSRRYMYSGANDVGDVAWYRDNSGGKTHEVGGKKANELGLYDMSGNVWEWCWDWYDSNAYTSHTRRNPVGPSRGSIRVNRGGGWNLYVGSCRSTARNGVCPGDTDGNLGFRLVRSVQ